MTDEARGGPAPAGGTQGCAAPMPAPPSGYDRFLEVEMPEWFVLDAQTDKGWIDWGFYGRHQFKRLDDGTYVCSAYGASPTFIHCVAHDEEGIDVLDGAETAPPTASVPTCRRVSFNGHRSPRPHQNSLRVNVVPHR